MAHATQKKPVELYKRERVPDVHVSILRPNHCAIEERKLLTVVQCIDASAQRDLISENNPNVDSQQAAGKPPTNWVTKKIDLLAGVVLCPETDAAQQEWPLIRMAGVRVTAGQLAVVVKHGSLKLKPLAQERQSLDFALRLLSSGILGSQRRNIFNQPDIRAGGDLLIAVDFLLVGTPFRQRLGVSPHGNFAGEVNEFEVAGNRLELLAVLAVLNPNLKQGVVDATAVGIILRNSGELLVGRIVGRSYVV